MGTRPDNGDTAKTYVFQQSFGNSVMCGKPGKRGPRLENEPLIWSVAALEDTASLLPFCSRFSVTLLHVAFC